MGPNETASVSTSLTATDTTLWTIIGILGLGVVARHLLDDEPFRIRRFLGEVLLSVIVGVVYHTYGLLNGLDPLQIILLGGLSALGSVRALEWVVKVLLLLKKVS